MRRGQLDRAVEGVVASAADVHLRFERHRAGPIQRLLVVSRKLSLAAQQVAFEVISPFQVTARNKPVVCNNACAVILLEDTCPQIKLNILWFAFAVFNLFKKNFI